MKIAKLYGGTIEVAFHKKTHRYYVNGKPAKRSATKVLSVLGKGDGLVNWIVNNALEESSKRVIEYLKSGMTIDESSLAAIQMIAKKKPDEKRDEAADEGTRVHEILEDWIDAGMEGTGRFAVAPRDKEYLLAMVAGTSEQLDMSVRQMVDWMLERKAIITGSERIVYSKQYDIPGMLDLEFEMADDPTPHIGDFKIRGGVYEETKMQTAIYQHASAEENGKKYGDRYVFRIGRKDGVFTGDFEPICYQDFPADIKAFENCLNLLTWKEQK